MARFLRQILLFSLIIAVLLGVGELVVRSLPNPYRLKHDWMERNAEEVETLILGHSQTYYGVDAGLLPGPAFNLANISQTLQTDSLYLAHYSPRLRNLNTVIVPLTYTSLYEYPLEDTDEWWRVIGYQLYSGLKPHPTLSRYSFELSDLSGYSSKLASAVGIKERRLRPDSLGHGTEFSLSSRYDGWEKGGADRAANHTASCHEEEMPRNLRVLAGIDSICRILGARLVLVTPPLWSTYRENIDSTLWEKERETVDDFCSRDGVLWLDYSADSRFTEEDFYDTDHLNSDKGARKFSLILANELFRN